MERVANLLRLLKRQMRLSRPHWSVLKWVTLWAHWPVRACDMIWHQRVILSGSLNISSLSIIWTIKHFVGQFSEIWGFSGIRHFSESRHPSEIRKLLILRNDPFPRKTTGLFFIVEFFFMFWRITSFCVIDLERDFSTGFNEFFFSCFIYADIHANMSLEHLSIRLLYGVFQKGPV